MLLRNKYERAKKWQLEQKAKREGDLEYNGEKLYEPSIADELEKGDMLALMVSGVLTILPLVTVLLLVMVLIGFLFMRIL
ncbi:MAG: hypothetical protein J6Z03_06280 [Erysipelotrichaceae bacterium]|nr:hypothetical protein [Erysipelotrichaceae bacterium]